MSSDKILSRIQLQIKELAPTLELFIDDTIQPSVADCESLQKQLSGIQENVAVYKYNKQNKELSPSFNIHAKVSQKEEEVAKKAEIVAEIKQTVKLEEEEKKKVKQIIIETPLVNVKPEMAREEVNQVKPKSPLAIGINDKFRFINELFAQNSSEYNIALEQINNLNTWNEAEIYLNSLKNVYEWDSKEESVVQFYLLVKKRFDS
jgi:hypothetical protein